MNDDRLAFETERLIIRPVIKEDRKLYVELYTNKETMRYIGEPFTADNASRAFENTVKAMRSSIETGKRAVMTWVVNCKSSNDALGIIALNWQTGQRYEPDKCSFHKEVGPEIGIMLAPNARGIKIASAAMSCLLDFAFNRLQEPYVQTAYCRSNIAMDKLANNLGFSNSSCAKSKLVRKCITKVAFCNKSKEVTLTRIMRGALWREV